MKQQKNQIRRRNPNLKASVVKDMLPYSLVINENNSYPYKNKEEFEVKFRTMLEDIKSGRANYFKLFHYGEDKGTGERVTS